MGDRMPVKRLMKFLRASFPTVMIQETKEMGAKTTPEGMKNGFQISYKLQSIDTNCLELCVKDFGAVPGLLRKTVMNWWWDLV